MQESDCGSLYLLLDDTDRQPVQVGICLQHLHGLQTVGFWKAGGELVPKVT